MCTVRAVRPIRLCRGPIQKKETARVAWWFLNLRNRASRRFETHLPPRARLAGRHSPHQGGANVKGACGLPCGCLGRIFPSQCPCGPPRGLPTKASEFRKKTRSSPPKVQSDVKPPYATSTMSPHMPHAHGVRVEVRTRVGPSVHVVNRLDGRSCCTSIYQPCTHGAKSAQTRRRAPHPTAGSCSTHKTGPRNTCRGPRMRGIQPATERRAGGRHVAVGCAGAALMCRGVEIHRNGEREGALHT